MLGGKRENKEETMSRGQLALLIYAKPSIHIFVILYQVFRGNYSEIQNY